MQTVIVKRKNKWKDDAAIIRTTHFPAVHYGWNVGIAIGVHCIGLLGRNQESKKAWRQDS
jgi:hypothetical protein